MRHLPRQPRRAMPKARLSSTTETGSGVLDQRDSIDLASTLGAGTNATVNPELDPNASGAAQ
jgi:hypothetical protein